VVKFILKANEADFQTFANYQSDRLLANMHHLAAGNGYHLIPEYQANFAYLRSLVKSRNL
jgi:hypothetical protein